jgi:hypothetical protein
VANWRKISEAPKGIGPLLLRACDGSLDPTFVGQQADDGRWLDGENREAHPAYFCQIPPFVCDEVAE